MKGYVRFFHVSFLVKKECVWLLKKACVWLFWLCVDDVNFRYRYNPAPAVDEPHFLDTACTEISIFANFRTRRNDAPQVRDPDPGMLHLAFFSRMTPYQRVGGVDLPRAPLRDPVHRHPYVRSRSAMTLAHSGGFDGTDVFNHPQNHPNGHLQRHAHRTGASARAFYNPRRGAFLQLVRVFWRQNTRTCRIF